MRQQIKYLTTEELRALHGDDYLEIVIVTRARIQKMNPERVAEAIVPGLQCVLDFVSGTTRTPRASTLSQLLKHIASVDGTGESASPPLSFSLVRARRDFPRKLRYVRPVRRSVARDRRTA